MDYSEFARELGVLRREAAALYESPPDSALVLTELAPEAFEVLERALDLLAAAGASLRQCYEEELDRGSRFSDHERPAHRAPAECWQGRSQCFESPSQPSSPEDI